MFCVSAGKHVVSDIIHKKSCRGSTDRNIPNLVRCRIVLRTYILEKGICAVLPNDGMSPFPVT